VEAIEYDINGEVPQRIADEDFDLVFGSPPCQGFSHAKGERKRDDERNNLVFDFIRWVDEIQPNFVLMENVPCIANISEGFLGKVKDMYREAGYTTADGILNSAEFGVPQKRERYILVGVKNETGAVPSLPEPTHRLPEDSQTTLGSIELKKDPVTVGDAISDLPEVTEDGTVELDLEPRNEFQRWVRNAGEEKKEIHNHTAKQPNDDVEIVRRIPEGKMYRSSRFGDRYVQAWNLFEDKFTEEEKQALWFIARHRTRKEYKTTDEKGPDYVPIERIEAKNEAVRSLFEDGWLRRITGHNGHDEAYDINSKSGVRPKYMRLHTEGVSNTLDAQSFNPREKLHPSKNRGLSLREGARIQSFPDSFVYGRTV